MTRCDTSQNNYGSYISISISPIHKFNFVTISLSLATTES